MAQLAVTYEALTELGALVGSIADGVDGVGLGACLARAGDAVASSELQTACEEARRAVVARQYEVGDALRRHANELGRARTTYAATDL